MDVYSRSQYLKALRREYLKIKSKKEKGKLLDEAEKRTGLYRITLIRKLKPKSNLDKRKEERNILTRLSLVKLEQPFGGCFYFISRLR